MRAKVKHRHFQQEIRLSENAGQLYIGQPQVRERQSATDKSSAQGLTLQNSFAVLGNGACVLPSGHALHARTNGHQRVVQSLPSACPLENQIVVVAFSQCVSSPVHAGRDQCMVQFLPAEFPLKVRSITCRVVLQTFQRVSRGGITFFGVRRAQSGCPVDAGSMGRKKMQKKRDT